MKSLDPAAQLRGAISTTVLDGGTTRVHVRASNLSALEAIALGQLVADVGHVARRETPSGLQVVELQRPHHTIRPRVRQHTR